MKPLSESFFSSAISFQKTREHHHIPLAIVNAAGAWLSFLIGGFLIFHFSASVSKIIYFFIFSFMIVIVLLSFNSMWIHFFSELFGGEGKVTILFSLFTACFTPLHLILPLSLIFKNSPFFIILPVLFIPILWAKILGFKAIKINYNLSYRKIWIVFFFPVFLTTMIFISIFFLAIIAFHG